MNKPLSVKKVHRLVWQFPFAKLQALFRPTTLEILSDYTAAYEEFKSTMEQAFARVDLTKKDDLYHEVAPVVYYMKRFGFIIKDKHDGADYAKSVVRPLMLEWLKAIAVWRISSLLHIEKSEVVLNDSIEAWIEANADENYASTALAAWLLTPYGALSQTGGIVHMSNLVQNLDYLIQDHLQETQLYRKAMRKQRRRQKRAQRHA